jgi:succinate-semialdehyde dehydrogenase/glutarate-semialdehyde dehydrogenase
MKMKSVNPYDLSVNAEFEEYSDAKVALIIDHASKAFLHWKTTSFKVRSDLFLACADKLMQKKAELAQTITREMGKPIREANAEIEKCAMVCRYYANNAEIFLRDEEVKTESYKSYIAFEPLGCILAVMPWNFPFWQVFRFAAPSLMAGNVGLLKHASNVPLCALEIEKIFIESGFPEGVFQSILVGSSKIPSLIAHKYIKAVTLTGSEKAGSEVASLAGKYIKKAVLELGGSDPFIVFDDANIQRAATMAVKSRMVNNGQSCIAAKRFIVNENVYDRFIGLVRENMLQLKQGDPLNMNTDLGPMARPDLLEDLMHKINESLQKGAKLFAGGGKMNFNAGFLEPTILTDVTKEMPAYYEELFGPVATIFKVKDNEEAISLANDTNYGLGASIWTSNLDLAEVMAKKIHAGSVFVNSIVSSDPRLPFGGINISGFGRELSVYGIKEFVNIKSLKLSI